MSVSQAILLSLLITGLLFFSITGYLEHWFHNVKKHVKSFRAKKSLSKLEKLGYFDLTPVDKQKESKVNVLRFLARSNDHSQLWYWEKEIGYDFRGFIIQENSRDDGIELDWKKWNEVFSIIGLDFKFGENREVSESIEHQEVHINGNKHLLIKDWDNEDHAQESFEAFSKIVNAELLKIGSKERTQIFGEYPTRILILNEALEELLLND
ncbi:MAG: hypothetical protein GQ574_16505 [Crocinitomix sp.]|nr:hypothetical protein [Crocinitomix sp.]